MAEDFTLVITRTFPAPQDKVWSAWTNKEELAKWFCPENMTASVPEFDFQEGGAYKIVMTNDKGEDHTAAGVIETIDAPNKLVWTWQWVDGVSSYKNKTKLMVELKEVGDGTEMTFTHSGFESEQQKTDHNKGWSSAFNQLGKTLS